MNSCFWRKNSPTFGPKSQGSGRNLERDEMHSYIGSKKKLAGSKEPSIATEISLFPVFWGWFDGEKTVEDYLQCGSRSCDDGRPYTSFVPAWKYILSKAQTFTVEGYNSLTRHFLARLRRKSKCYSKCKKMLELSSRLLMQKRISMKAIL